MPNYLCEPRPQELGLDMQWFKALQVPITTARIVKHIHVGIKFMMLIIGYDVTNKSCQKIDS